MKSLTIVIPVRNRASIVLSTLESIAVQSCRDFDLVIVDNNSTDNSYTTVESWISTSAPKDIDITLLREFTPGASAARNAGANVAHTPYIAFFDSDDTMRPNYVESILDTFRAHPGTDIVYWKKCIHYGHNFIHLCRFSTTRILEFHIWHSMLSTQSWAARTSLFRSLGGWNEQLLQWDDWELGIRIATTPKLKATPIATCLVDVYSHGASISGSSFSSRAGGWERALDTAWQFCESLPKGRQRRHLGRLLNYKEAVLSGNYRHERNQSSARALMKRLRRRLRYSLLQRIICEFTYFYTGMGFRGCASIVGRLL